MAAVGVSVLVGQDGEHLDRMHTQMVAPRQARINCSTMRGSRFLPVRRARHLYWTLGISGLRGQLLLAGLVPHPGPLEMGDEHPGAVGELGVDHSVGGFEIAFA